MIKKKVKKTLTARERQNEIFELIQEKGFWNINKAELGRKYGVSTVQIHKDFKKIMRDYDPKSNKEFVSKALDVGFIRSLKECDKLLSHKDPGLRLGAAKTMVQIKTKYSEFLESWGWKDKVAEKQEVTHKGDIFDIFKKLDEDE